MINSTNLMQFRQNFRTLCLSSIYCLAQFNCLLKNVMKIIKNKRLGMFVLIMKKKFQGATKLDIQKTLFEHHCVLPYRNSATLASSLLMSFLSTISALIHLITKYVVYTSSYSLHYFCLNIIFFLKRCFLYLKLRIHQCFIYILD